MCFYGMIWTKYSLFEYLDLLGLWVFHNSDTHGTQFRSTPSWASPAKACFVGWGVRSSCSRPVDFTTLPVQGLDAVADAFPQGSMVPQSIYIYIYVYERCFRFSIRGLVIMVMARFLPGYLDP